jgi:phosphatidate cytidylyltransferase
MLRERLAVTLLLIPPALWIISTGGLLYLAGVTLLLGMAAAEYGLLFRRGGQRPALALLVGGAMLLSAGRQLLDTHWLGLALGGLLLAAMAWHALDYERGAQLSGTDFAVTVSGMLYLGWIGGYLVALRGLPDGEWWVLLALPSVWLADSAAYLVGQAVGRRKLSPRLSPNKTWEGYLAGVAAGALAGAGLAALWRIGAGADSSLSAGLGAAVGGMLGAITPLGDLGISMFKRQMQVKDTGALFSGHGGVLDRMDSWLWAGALAYYLVGWLS